MHRSGKQKKSSEILSIGLSVFFIDLMRGWSYIQDKACRIPLLVEMIVTEKNGGYL
jgi:hypothetical protein